MVCVSGIEPNFIYLNLMLYNEQQTMLNPYTRYIYVYIYTYIRHLAYTCELAEGAQLFPALCESNVCRRFTSLFHITLSVEWPLVINAEFSASLLQSSASHDPSEIILIC